MEQMHHEKIGGGEGFCRNLAYLGGEVRKLFVHFAGHQVSDFKAKMHQIRFPPQTPLGELTALPQTP